MSAALLLETTCLFWFYSEGHIFYFYSVSYGPNRQPEGDEYEPIKISSPRKKNFRLSQHDPKAIINKPQVFQCESKGQLMTRYTQDRPDNTAKETEKQISERRYKGAQKQDETTKPPRKTSSTIFWHYS
jgi:hypothetical protein